MGLTSIIDSASLMMITLRPTAIRKKKKKKKMEIYSAYTIFIAVLSINQPFFESRARTGPN